MALTNTQMTDDDNLADLGLAGLYDDDALARNHEVRSPAPPPTPSAHVKLER